MANRLVIGCVARQAWRAAAAMAATLLWATAALAQFQNADAPIDVTADQLEILQEDRKAVFRGRVVAVQEGARLTADEVTLMFAASETPGGEAAASDSNGDWGELSRMLAAGAVTYTTASEAAVGDNAVYDAQTETLTLTGDVTVRRGRDVLRGARLVVNVATGESVMESGGDGRVRGLFHLQSKTPDAPGGEG
ncbi:MAG: LptA/OstA family protein [Pseudomonadota bacterium]